jgi:hypothetical protein
MLFRHNITKDKKKKCLQNYPEQSWRSNLEAKFKWINSWGGTI